MSVLSPSPAIAPFLAAAQARRLPGRGLAWLDAARARALTAFAAHGLPTRRNEAWKFSGLPDLGGLVHDLQPDCHAPLDPALMARFAHDVEFGHRLVFVDGRFDAGLSALDRLPGNVRLRDLGAALAEDADGLRPWLDVDIAEPSRSLAAYAAACADHGAVLQVGAGASLDPIHLIFLHRSGATQARNFIILDEGASATVLESHIGGGSDGYWANAATRIAVGAHAVLRHAALQDEGPGAVRTAATDLTIAAGGSYQGFALGLGAAFARDEMAARLEGTNAEARLAAAMFARRRQYLDTTWAVDHVKPGGTTGQTMRTVADDRARVVFQGRIEVAPHAQKTDARQLCRHLLLSDQAEADTKPELVILADDVVCSHGASIGDIEPDHLFYLLSRGIAPEQARGLLIAAHLAEPIGAIDFEPLRRFFRHELARALGLMAEDLA